VTSQGPFPDPEPSDMMALKHGWTHVLGRVYIAVWSADALRTDVHQELKQSHYEGHTNSLSNKEESGRHFL
jgi:hypothetical protein